MNVIQGTTCVIGNASVAYATLAGLPGKPASSSNSNLELLLSRSRLSPNPTVFGRNCGRTQESEFVTGMEKDESDTKRTRRVRAPLTEAQKASRREANRKWQKANGEKRAVHAKKYREKNKAKIAAREKEWREKNQEKYIKSRLKSSRKWHAANRERNRELCRARYARITGREIGEARPAVGTLLPQQLMTDALYAAAFKAVPKTLPSYVRDDIISDIVVAVLEQRIAEDDIAKRAQEFVKGYWRQFGHIGKVSLDQLAFADGKTTVGDNITYDDVRW